MKKDDRRAFERFAFSGQFLVGTDAERRSIKLLDISLGGMRLDNVEQDLTEGDVLHGTLELKVNELFVTTEIKCKIVSLDPEGCPRLQFVDPPNEFVSFLRASGLRWKNLQNPPADSATVERLKPSRKLISLASSVYLSYLLGLVLLVFVSLIMVPKILDDFTNIRDREVVSARMNSLIYDFQKVLHDRFSALEHINSVYYLKNQESFQNYLEGVASDPVIEWIAVVDANGLVENASNRDIIDNNYAQTDWFLKLGVDQSEYVTSDVQRGKIFLKDSIYFIQPSFEVDTQDAKIFLIKLKAEVIQDYLISAARIRDLDLITYTSSDTIFASSLQEGVAIPASIQEKVNLLMVRDITANTWDNGADYITAIFPELIEINSADLNLSFVGIMQIESISDLLLNNYRSVFLFLLLSVSVFAFAAICFIWIFVRPISKLISVAEKISHGQAIYPSKSISTYEARSLHSSLVRFQSKEFSGGL